MYDNAPNFGFVQSSMPGLPTTLDQINPAYYSQIANFIQANGGRLASVCGVNLYDTLRIDDGALPSQDFVFFQNAVGSSQGLFVAGTQYTKQAIDVTPWLTNGGQLSKGYEALIWSIGVQFQIVQQKDLTIKTSGNGVNLTATTGSIADSTAAGTFPMGNLLRAFQEGLYFQLFVNQTRFEDGPGWRFPSGCYGMSGESSLVGASANDGAVGDGWVNNGFGWSYQLPVMRHIPELTKFGVKMSVQNSFTTPTDFSCNIVVTLEGIGIQPVTG